MPLRACAVRLQAMDICITAVEKYPDDMEKCTQVRGPAHERVSAHRDPRLPEAVGHKKHTIRTGTPAPFHKGQ